MKAIQGLFMLLGVLLMLLVKCFEWLSAYRKHRKAKPQTEQCKQAEQQRKQAEIAAWQADLHAKANAIRQSKQEQKERTAAECAQKCETLSGYLEVRQALYREVLDLLNILSGNYRMDPDTRTQQVIWESVKIILESKNAKTIESRINVIQQYSESLGYPVVDNYVFKLLHTHGFLVQIAALQDKKESYKTQAAKNKADTKMEELFEQALSAETVYRQPLQEFRLLCKQQNAEALANIGILP